MRQPDDSWSEFDWERALRESDEQARKYFQLLQRFCDLPGGEELIAGQMGGSFQEAFLDFDLGDLHGEWDDELPGAEKLAEGNEASGEDTEDDNVLFYERDPVFSSLRQAAVGWCNVYAAILPGEGRKEGLNVLYHIGRALANLAFGIDDGVYDAPAGSVAFAKRSLSSLNQAIATIDRLLQDHPRYEELLRTIRGHLINSTDGLTDHIQRARNQPPPKPGS
ncbi:MAG: hypothetical protein HN849_06100 [Victivallales bacterium]|jgi:hypothetical protein|nr:hypothetical protein [Victivallales bacterium]MBT7164433.1 hypothetical protein [Victivallales bacterium]MBT7299060.1 hypothetical protein [Victivallales bacterium]